MKTISELDILKFRNECLLFIKGICSKITERSPLKYPLLKDVSCFSPKLILNNPEIAKSRLKMLLNLFVDHRRIAVLDAEHARKEFDELVSSA